MYDGTMKNVRQQDTGTEIQITRAQSEDILSARINQKTDFVYNAKTGELKIGEETFVTDAGIRDFSLLFDDVILEMTADCGTILFLTVSKNKIAAMPENIGVVAILTVVLNYSILFPSFTFFLDGFHLAFGDKFEICIKTTDLM